MILFITKKRLKEIIREMIMEEFAAMVKKSVYSAPSEKLQDAQGNLSTKLTTVN